jgi:alanine racemase
MDAGPLDGGAHRAVRALAEAPVSATLSIDLSALKANYATLAAAAAPAACGAAVKAHAYGLGMLPVSLALWEAGCRTFFVALPAEGAALRQALPEAEIVLLDGLLPRSAEACVAHRLTPALASLEEAEEFARHARTLERRLPAAIHIDTGLNRLGMNPAETEALARRSDILGALDITLVISHLACADEPGHEMNDRQREAFNGLRALFPNVRASLANSPGTLSSSYACDLVRPGIALYGGNPFTNRANPMRPVVRLYASVLQVREVPAGDSVGYNATWTARRTSRIAIIGAGYADGMPRALSSKPLQEGGDTTEAEPALVFIGGQFAPVTGRVSMDLMAVDVTDIDPGLVRRGTTAELIGDHVTLDDIARWSGTTPYEILTRLGSRFARLYSAS